MDLDSVHSVLLNDLQSILFPKTAGLTTKDDLYSTNVFEKVRCPVCL